MAFRGALLELTANETIGGTQTPLPWDNAIYDTDSFWTGVGVDAHKLFVPNGVARVRCTACVRFNDSSTSGAGIAAWIRKNAGSTAKGCSRASWRMNTGSGGYTQAIALIFTGIIKVTNGDYFDCVADGADGSVYPTVLSGVDTYFGIEVMD